MTDAPDGSSRDLNYFFAVPLRRWPTVLLTMLVFGVGALALLQVVPTTASASAAVNVNAFSAELFQDTRAVETLIDVPAETQVARSPAVIAAAAASLGREDDAADIREHVEATGTAGGTTITITYAGSSPDEAATVANTVALAYLEYRLSEAVERQRSALRLINERLAQARGRLAVVVERLSNARPGSRRETRSQSARTVLTGKIASLTTQKDTTSTMVMSPGTLVDPATAEAAEVFPRPGLVIPPALLLGFAIGLLLTFLEERLDKRLQRPSQLVDAAQAPVLAMVSPGAYDATPSTEDVAQLRLVRARVLAAVSSEAFSLLLVDIDERSSLNRLGRHLAALVATSGLPVTMMRVGRVSDELRREEIELVDTAPGSGEATGRTLELAHAVRADGGTAGSVIELADPRHDSVPVDEGTAGRQLELADQEYADDRAGLEIEQVVDGEVSLTDTLQDPRVTQRVRQLQRQGRAVIVTPAGPLERSEVIALARSVEAVVVVVHGSHADRRDIAAMCEDARRSGARVLGTIWCTKQAWWKRQRGYATSVDGVEQPGAVAVWQ